MSHRAWPVWLRSPAPSPTLPHPSVESFWKTGWIGAPSFQGSSSPAPSQLLPPTCSARRRPRAARRCTTFAVGRPASLRARGPRRSTGRGPPVLSSQSSLFSDHRTHQTSEPLLPFSVTAQPVCYISFDGLILRDSLTRRQATRHLNLDHHNGAIRPSSSGHPRPLHSRRAHATARRH